MRTVVVLEEAAEDIEVARTFYDAQDAGAGNYFADSVIAGICDVTQTGSAGN